MRKRIVSRTVKVTKVTATVFNPATRNVSDTVYTVIGDYPEKDIVKRAQKALAVNGEVVGAISKVETAEELRYMTEDYFYAHSQIMEPKDGENA